MRQYRRVALLERIFINHPATLRRRHRAGNPPASLLDQTRFRYSLTGAKSGKVVGRHYKRQRRVEFLDFMNKLVADHPDREIHILLDNLSTHKPKRDMWLKRHKNMHFHFTPTHASWLNQVEIWFSILAAQSLDGASFQSVPELIAHIEAFIADYNETAKPFIWTKREVHQKRLKPCFAE
jgi:transposase